MVVLMAGLWVMSVMVYLFSGQKITLNVMYCQNESKAEKETTSKLLASRHVTRHYNEDFELEDIVKCFNKHTWETYGGPQGTAANKYCCKLLQTKKYCCK